MRRLPPLKALRAFEAAARHLSFTRAAEELYVTQAAVSHQVKQLEQHLGVRLFQRLNRALMLTPEGQSYLLPVRRAFEMLEDATARLVELEPRGPVSVSVLPSFASRWLVPRLGRFRERWPEADVRVAPDVRVVDFRRDQIDVAIRYGTGDYPGLYVRQLMTEVIFPVCSPELLVGGRRLREPADLAGFTLLHDDGHGVWRMWLAEAGVDEKLAERGYVFTDSSLLVQAALAGQGVALARGALVADELEAGRLVRPFDRSLPARFAYYVVCPESTAERPLVRAFIDWLREEAGRTLGGQKIEQVGQALE